MIDLYRTKFGVTPNIYKIIFFLEEADVPYRMLPIDIARGEQFSPEFLAINPNNKVPAIVDNEPLDGGKPISVFESGAILTYLADKTDKFLPPFSDPRGRNDVLQWVYWQMAGFGPHWGGFGYYTMYSPEKIPFAVERHRRELDRLFGVLDNRLKHSPFVGGDSYSIADMINFASTMTYERLSDDMAAKFPNFVRWHAEVKQRPAIVRSLDPNHVPVDFGGAKYADDANAMKILFQQTSDYVKGNAPAA